MVIMMHNKHNASLMLKEVFDQNRQISESNVNCFNKISFKNSCNTPTQICTPLASVHEHLSVFKRVQEAVCVYMFVCSVKGSRSAEI